MTTRTGLEDAVLRDMSHGQVLTRESYKESRQGPDGKSNRRLAEAGGGGRWNG